MLFFLITCFVLGALVLAPFSETGRTVLGFAITTLIAVSVRALLGAGLLAAAFYAVLF